RNHRFRGADAVNPSGRQHRRRRYGQAVGGPRAVEDPAHAWKLLAREPGDPTGIRPGVADRPEKVVDRTSGMYAGGKSDGRIVPGKPPNKGMRLAEAVEGRRPAKGNTQFRATCRTQSRVCVLFFGQWVRGAAR